MNANFKSDCCAIASALISGMNVAYLKPSAGLATMNGQQNFEVDFEKLVNDSVKIARLIHWKADAE